MVYKHGTLAKRTRTVATVYKPKIEGNDWFASQWHENTYSDFDLEDIDVSMNVFKDLLKMAILNAKDVEDVRISNLRTFLAKEYPGNAKYNRLVNSWNPKELVYYGYQYNSQTLSNFNTLLLKRYGLTVDVHGLDVTLYLDGRKQGTVGFSADDAAQYEFFKQTMNGRNTLNPNAKGILLEQYMSQMKYNPVSESNQEDRITKRILVDSIGSEMGVVDLLYTGEIVYEENEKPIISGSVGLIPIDVKFSSRKDGLLNIFKGISGMNVIIKMDGNYPKEFRQIPEFKKQFVEYLQKEISNSLLQEAEDNASGEGSRILRDKLNVAIKNVNTDFTKALTIVLALSKIVNNISNIVNKMTTGKEFPVFVQNPGLLQTGNEYGVISDILFTSDILNSIYMNLFDGESVLNSTIDYGLRKDTKVEVSSKAYTASSDSYRKSIVMSAADVPVMPYQQKMGVDRHKKAMDRILNSVKFTLVYGKMGG